MNILNFGRKKQNNCTANTKEKLTGYILIRQLKIGLIG